MTKGPQVGELREWVTIRRQSNVKNPSTGGLTRTWADVAASLPAKVRSINGREAVVGSVLQGVSQFEIVIRYRADVEPSDQIIWLTSNNRELNIHAAEDRVGDKRWLVINASTEAPQGAAT